jgi:hypothetical protein
MDERQKIDWAFQAKKLLLHLERRQALQPGESRWTSDRSNGHSRNYL